MPLSVDIFNKKILSSQSRFGKYDILLSGEAGGSEFTVRPTVNGTGVLLSGEAAGLPETIVYTTGDQTISGNKIFANDITIQGAVLVNQVIDITTTGSISGVTGEFKYLRAEGGMISGDNFDFYADDIVFSGLNLYVTDSTGIFTNRPLVNGTGVLLSGEEQNIFKAGYLTTDSGNFNIYQSNISKNLYGRRGNFNLKNAIIPNLTSGDFVFYTISPDSSLIQSNRPVLPAKPYLVVKNTTNLPDSYQPPEGGGASPISSTNFINLNTDGPHSGLALQHVRFHPVIQNAYKKYYLTFGQDITVPMSNRYLESFIEIVWPSGQYWSVTNSGIQQYTYNVRINQPKAISFTQSHIVNFKITFEQDNRVGTVPNYDSRRINFIYGGNLFSVSGANYEFIQKERCILTVNNGMQRW